MSAKGAFDAALDGALNDLNTINVGAASAQTGTGHFEAEFILASVLDSATGKIRVVS